MSYCRWSSDNWMCDLYCYEDIAGGFTTHVATNRTVEKPPMAPFPSTSAPIEVWERWGEAHHAQMEWLKTAKREPIGLPHDGETFNDPDLRSFLSRLVELREMGYNVPERVIQGVRNELAAERSTLA